MAEPAFVTQTLREAPAERQPDRLRRAVMVRPAPELRVVPSRPARVEPAEPRGWFAGALAALRREFELWRWRRSTPHAFDD